MKLRFEALCHSSVALLFVLASCSTVTAFGSHRVRTINKHGRPIPSIYYGAIPDSRVVYELKSPGKGHTSCLVVKAVYRESSNKPRFLPVVGGCGGHYQVDYYRNCGSACGGTEDWTYSDSFVATWCDGYTFNQEGCATMTCTDQYTCWNDTCP